MREIRRILMLAVFALMAFVTFGQKYNSLWVDGRIYFKVSNSVSLDVPNENGRIMPKDLPFLGDLVEEYQITNVDMPFLSASSKSINHIWRMDFGAIDKIESLIKDMGKIGVVEYAEPAPLFFISNYEGDHNTRAQRFTPNDTYYNTTLNYSPSWMESLMGSEAYSVNSSWHLNLINAQQAWDETDGSADITVAVLDNAIWIDHPDLTNMVDRVNSIDLGDGDDNPNPPEANYIWSHGTHSAGLIGAEKNNGIGVASIGSGVKIMAVKLGTDASDGQSMAAGFEGIIYAADHGADVINMSWGSPQFFQTMQNIVNYAYNKGCIMLGAAGNNGNGQESQMNEEIPVNYTGYPAALEHVIAVGSCDVDDRKSDFSCYGTWLDLLSPGGYAYQASGMMPISSFAVLSTTYNTAGTFSDMLSGQMGGLTGGEMEYPTGGAGSCGVTGNYDIMQGTSMACPVASGLAGLVLSKNPTLTPEELTEVMKSTCVNVDAINPEFVDSMGAGRIDAYAAVLAAGQRDMTLVADFEASEVILATGDAINFTDKSVGSPTSWFWEFEGGTPAYSTEQNPQGIAYNQAGIYQVILTVSNGENSDTETKTYFILVGQSTTLGESAWEEQNTHFAAQYRASYNIEIVNPQTIWFTTLNGTDGTVARDFGVTTDGGTTWVPKTFSYDADWMPGDISAINGTTAWSANYSSEASGKGAIFKTTDGGDTWTRQGENLYQNDDSFLNIVHFFNENEGYAQGDPVSGNFEIYRTTDGGGTWTAVSAPAAQSQEASTVGLDWAIGDIAWFGTSKGRIYKTTDKGATWTVLSTGTTKMVTEMSWADEMNGAVTVANLDQTTGQTSAWQFLKTTDGGETWTEVGVTANYFSSFCLVPGTPGMIVATKSASTLPDNFSAYSTDWGTSWEVLDDSVQYIQVRMYDINTGWAGGFNWDENNGGIYKWLGIDMGLYFTSTPVTTIAENELYTYNVTAENGTNSPITIEMTTGPEWLELTEGEGNGQYVLSGMPQHIITLQEDYDIVLTATDGIETETQSFTISVTSANSAPEFISEPIDSTIKDAEYVYHIVCEDPDNDALVISAIYKPSWATFVDNGDGTAELRGTSHTVTNVGSGSRVTIKVEDGLNSVSQNFYIRTVDNNGLGLRFTSMPTTRVEEETVYTYNVTAENESEDPITIEMTDGPDWLTLDLTEEQYVLSGTAPQVSGFSEDFEVELTATDGTETKTQSYTINVVSANSAPVFESDPMTSAIINIEYVYNIICEDADNDALVISALEKPSWITFVDNGDGTAVLRGTSTSLTSSGPGSTVTLKVEDELHSTTQSFFLRTIEELNFTSTPGENIIAENYGYSYNVTAQSATNATIIIEMTTGPEWLTLTQGEENGHYVLSGTAPIITSSTYDYDVVLTANDGIEEKTQSFTIRVISTNTAPIFDSEPEDSATVNVEYVYNIECHDPENNDLTISALLIPAWATFVDNGDGTATISGTPTIANPNVRFVIEVRDYMYSTTQSFYVRVLDPTVTVEDLGMGEIALYPNPTDGQLTIENCEGANYEIYDITGRAIATGLITNNVETINIASEISGNLVIRIINDNKVITRHIVKL